MEVILLAVFGFFMLLLVVLFFGCESISSLFNEESHRESERSVTKHRHEQLHGTSSLRRL
jgi:hypothetical protein